MPSEITLRIPCESYLAQWFIHDSGARTPVRLRKNSPEMHLLRVLLASKSSRISAPSSLPSAPSAPLRENENLQGISSSLPSFARDNIPQLEIVIPHFRGMPPESYNYISPRGEKIFVDLLRRRFDLRLFSDLVPLCEYVHRRDELILEWMEQNGIEPEERHWFAVEKRLTRLLDRMKTAERVRRYRQRKKSSKNTLI